MDVYTFDFRAPAFEITKALRDENGQMYIEGVAATTAVDLTKEQMSPEAIAKMALGLIGKPLRAEHQKGYLDKLGEIVKADVIDVQGKPALWIKARLYDWSTLAKDTFSAINSGIKLGLSVAGKVNPGGLVKDFAEHLGEYIPTYKDVVPTEVSVTDHPANIETFAHAVYKSMHEQIQKDYEAYEKTDKEVTNAHTKKPAIYADVPDDKFLDPENYKYPADAKHLLPALQYFNHDGQRDKGGYTPEKWATMGRKLASFLGEGYTYDSDSEKVVKETKKREEVKEDMAQDLVTKQLPEDIQDWVKVRTKEMAPRTSLAAKEIQKSEEEEAKKEELAKAGSAATASPAATSTSTGAVSTDGGTSATKPDAAQTPPAKVKKDASTSDIMSQLSSLASTLEQLKDSISSASDSSSSSGSSDSTSTGSSSTSSPSSTSTDKAVSTTPSGSSSTGTGSTSTGSTSTGSSSDSGSSSSDSGSSDSDFSSLESAMNSLKKDMDTLTQLMAKGKKGSQQPASSGSVETDSSMSEKNPQMTKSLEAVAANMQQMTEVMKVMKEELGKKDELIKSLNDKVDAIPNMRKGKAFLLEKGFDGQVTIAERDVKKSYTHDEFVDMLKQDKDIDFNTMHNYMFKREMPDKYNGKISVTE